MKLIAFLMAVFFCASFLILESCASNVSDATDKYTKAQGINSMFRDCMRNCKSSAQGAVKTDCVTNCVKKYPLRPRIRYN